MNNSEGLAIVLMTMLTAGCAGTIKTYDIPPKTCEKSRHCYYEGVLYRPLVPRDRDFLRDRILNGQNELTHHMRGADGQRCTPVKVTVTELVPDLEREFLIAYDAAFFESSKFSVSLNPNGTLSNVGYESTPGGKALVDSLVSLVTTREAILSDADARGLLDDDRVDRAKDPYCSHGELDVPPELE